ncbi:MAG: hypothetical protein MZW92_60390 [Comamonadaceae bacterium]|nr:hypothetical protein [Comamonadaceae bacterium]
MAALSVPAGFTRTGFPFGVTFIAPGGSDAALVALAAQWERRTSGRLGCRLRSRPRTTGASAPFPARRRHSRLPWSGRTWRACRCTDNWSSEAAGCSTAPRPRLATGCSRWPEPSRRSPGSYGPPRTVPPSNSRSTRCRWRQSGRSWR